MASFYGIFSSELRLFNVCFSNLVGGKYLRVCRAYCIKIILVLVDLDIPCNTLELEIFCRLVDLGGDPDANGMHSGSVDYADFAEPLVSHLELLNPEPILTAFKPRSLNVFYHQSTMPRLIIASSLPFMSLSRCKRVKTFMETSGSDYEHLC